MKKSTQIKLGGVVFFLIVTLDSLAIIFNEMTLRYIFKPLIIPTLLVIYLVTTPKINKLYVGALCFALMADVVILNSTSGAYVLGLGFFLLMHLTYIMIITNPMHHYNTKKLLLAGVPFLTVIVFVLFFVSDKINDYLWPILIYGIVVCLFSALTFYCYLEHKTRASIILLLGAFFFIISNSMSAIEKFRLQNRDLSVGIMFTYAIAQFLIYQYMVRKAEDTHVYKDLK